MTPNNSDWLSEAGLDPELNELDAEVASKYLAAHRLRQAQSLAARLTRSHENLRPGEFLVSAREQAIVIYCPAEGCGWVASAKPGDVSFLATALAISAKHIEHPELDALEIAGDTETNEEGLFELIPADTMALLACSHDCGWLRGVRTLKKAQDLATTHLAQAHGGA